MIDIFNKHILLSCEIRISAYFIGEFMKHIILFAILVMAISQVAMAKGSKRHQERPLGPVVRDIR